MIKVIVGAYDMIENQLKEQIFNLMEEGHTVLLSGIFGTNIVLMKAHEYNGEDNGLLLAFRESRISPTVYKNLNDFMENEEITKVLGTINTMEFS